jgi:hypothetical protein
MSLPPRYLTTNQFLLRWLISKGREEEAWEILAMFDAEGADHQREKIEEAIRREQERQRELLLERDHIDRASNNQHGTSKGFCFNLKKNEHVSAVAETFEDGPRGRTIFGMLVSCPSLTNCSINVMIHSLWAFSNFQE